MPVQWNYIPWRDGAPSRTLLVTYFCVIKCSVLEELIETVLLTVVVIGIRRLERVVSLKFIPLKLQMPENLVYSCSEV